MAVMAVSSRLKLAGNVERMVGAGTELFSNSKTALSQGHKEPRKVIFLENTDELFDRIVRHQPMLSDSERVYECARVSKYKLNVFGMQSTHFKSTSSAMAHQISDIYK